MRLLVKYSGRRTVTLLLAQRQNLYFCHRVLARRVAGAAMAGNASRIPDRSPSRKACTGPAACCLTGTDYAWSAVMQLDGCRASRIVSTLASVRSRYDHCNRRRRRMWPLLGSIVREIEIKNDNKCAILPRVPVASSPTATRDHHHIWMTLAPLSNIWRSGTDVQLRSILPVLADGAATPGDDDDDDVVADYRGWCCCHWNSVGRAAVANTATCERKRLKNARFSVATGLSQILWQSICQFRLSNAIFTSHQRPVLFVWYFAPTCLTYLYIAAFLV